MSGNQSAPVLSDKEAMDTCSEELFEKYKDNQAEDGVPGIHCYDLTVMKLDKSFNGVYDLPDDEDRDYFAYLPPDEQHIEVKAAKMGEKGFLNVKILRYRYDDVEKKKPIERYVTPPMRLLWGVDINDGKWRERESLKRFNKLPGNYDVSFRENIVHSMDLVPGLCSSGVDDEYKSSKKEDNDESEEENYPVSISSAGGYFFYWAFLSQKVILKKLFNVVIEQKRNPAFVRLMHQIRRCDS